MNETQRGVRDDTLLSSRKGSRVMTVDKNKYILSINGMISQNDFDARLQKIFRNS